MARALLIATDITSQFNMNHFGSRAARNATCSLEDFPMKKLTSNLCLLVLSTSIVGAVAGCATNAEPVSNADEATQALTADGNEAIASNTQSTDFAITPLMLVRSEER